MGTPALIGIIYDDGTVDAISVNYDGYLDGVGKTLLQHYTDPTKIAELISLGDLSSLGAEIAGEHASFDRTVAYHRDHGELWETVQPTTYRDKYAARSYLRQYLYLWDSAKQVWWFCRGDEEFELLEHARERE